MMAALSAGGGFVLNNLISLKQTVTSNEDNTLNARKANALANEICEHVLETNFPKDSDSDYICSLLFSDENGLIYFLKRSATDNAFKEPKSKILEFLVKFLDRLGRKMQPYMIVLKNAGLGLFLMDSASKNKELAVQLMVKVLENYQGSGADELDVEDLVNKIYTQLMQPRKLTPTVRAAVFHLLGILCRRFPELMMKSSEKILRLFLDELKKQTRSPDFKMIAGCLQGLSGYLFNFTQGFDENAEISREIFEHTLKIIRRTADVTRYAMTIAALELLGNHCHQFSPFIYDTHQVVYDGILTWVKHNNVQLRKIALTTLDAFFRQMADMFMQKSGDGNAKGIFQFYIKEFQQLMNNVDNSYELSVAIRGYGLFAAPCKLFLSDDDVRFMFNDIISRSEQIYSNPNSEIAQENVQVLPSFIESLASIIVHVNTIDQTLQRSLECLAVLLIENYPQIAGSRQFTCSLAILNLLFSMHSKQAQYKSFLTRIVFQGMLRTCSHPVATLEDPSLTKPVQDEIKDARKLSFKDYVDLWKDLLNVVSTKGFANKPLVDRESVAESIYDEIITAIFNICNKLDLRTRKSDGEMQGDVGEVSFDPVAGLEPVNVNDFEILVNLVDVCNDLLPHNHCNYFEKWLHRFSSQIISFCTKFPYVSAFYKMMEISFKICTKINYFRAINDSPDVEMTVSVLKEEKDNCWRLFSKFIQQVTVHTHQFKDDLLASCLRMVLSLPKEIVGENLTVLVTCVQMALRIGLSYLPLAICAIGAIEVWTSCVKPMEIEPHLGEIVPCLNEYLISSRDSVSDSVTLQTSSSKRGKSKIILKNYNKQKAQVGFDDIRFRILLILGSMGSKAISHMVASSPREIASLAVAWDDKKHLDFAMPFADMKPIIFLDIFLPRVIDLAKTASDRQTKVAAIELLHSLVLFMIGRGAQKPDTFQSKYPMDKLYQRVFPAVLSLACDPEQVAKQLFESLALQIIHWFTNSRKYESVETKALLDAIMDCVVHPSDPRLRDFGARCLKEFVSWSIKQSDSKDQVNIASVVKRICILSLHPGVFHRLGAALAFNSVYAILRKDEGLISVFIVDLLYHFVTSLAMAHQDERSFATRSRCVDALDHIQRIVCVKADLINRCDPLRRVPKDINGGTLNCVVTWLIQQCASPLTDCRRKCMRLAYEFIPKTANIPSCKCYFQDLLAQKGPNFITETFEKSLSTNTQIPDTNDENYVQKTTEWHNSFLAPLDCYVWLFGEKLLSPNDIFAHQNSNLAEYLAIFLDHFNPHNRALSATPTEIDLLEQTKCSVVIRLMDLIAILLDVYSDKISENLFSFLFDNASLWNLFSRVIVEPNSVGFNLADSQVLIDLPKEVEHFLRTVKRNLRADLLEKWRLSLNQQLLQSDCAVLFATSFHLNEETVSLRMTYYLNAVHSLHSNGFPISLSDKFQSSSDIGKQFLHVVVESIVARQDGRLSYVQIEPNIYNLADKMLEIALKLEIPDSDLIECLLDDTCVVSTSHQSVNKRGDLFLSCFASTLSSHVATRSFSLLPMIIERADADRLSQLLVTILDHIGKDRSLRKTWGGKVLTCLMESWPKLSRKLNNRDKATERNSILAVLTKMLTIDSKAVCDETNASFESLFKCYLNMFNDTNAKLPFKNRLIDFLPCFTSLNDGHLQQLKDSLMEMSSQSFPLKSQELNTGTIKWNEYVGIFNKILSAFERSGSLMLLEFIISIVSREQEHVCEERVQISLAKYMKSLSIDKQHSAIEVAYGIFTQENSFPNEIRIASLQRFCLPLLQHSNNISFNNFFVQNIKQIMKTLESNEDKNNEGKLQMQLISKIGCYQLIGAMYNRLNKEHVYGKGSVLNQKFCGGLNCNGNELTKSVISCGNVTRKSQLCNSGANVVELRRKQNCAAYNMLIEVICCTQLDVKMYNGFLFNENPSKGDIFLDNLIDVNKTYQFDLELEELFKRKRQFLRVRKEALEQKRAETSENDIEDEEPPQSIHYITSQYLCGSSLSEEVSQFDFSMSNQVFLGEKPKPQTDTSRSEVYEEVTLELDELNKHECMASMNALIRHMHTSQMIPIAAQLPTCLQTLVNKLKCNATHQNIKLFVVKLIVNNSEIFEPFAQFLLEPLVRMIIDGFTGACLNYMTNDVLIMILRWARVAIPADTIADRSLANRLLMFALNCAYHARRDVYRNNLEIVKTLVELWKPRLELPIEFIFDNLNDSDTESKRNVIGIQFLGIFLANEFAPFVLTNNLSKEKFYKALSFNLVFKSSVVYGAAAEVVGMAMRYLADKENEVDGIFHTFVLERLDELAANHKDRFITVLYKLQLHYPPFAKNLVHKIVFLLPKMHGVFQLLCLEIIENQIEVMDNAFIQMKAVDIDKLITQRQEKIQMVALKIVAKIARFCPPKDLLYLVQNVRVVLNQPSAPCRKLAYDICMWVYDNYKDETNGGGEHLKNEAKSALLAGLADPETSLKLLVTNYWSHETRTPTTTLERALAILDNLYCPSVEEKFLGYASSLLLEMASRSPDFKRKMFDYPLSECDFVDYSVNYAWNARHSAMTPMFTQQSQSNLKDEEKMIKATQRELEFTPTQQNQSGAYNWLTQSRVDTFAITESLNASSVPSAMLFTRTKKTPGSNFGRELLQPTPENAQIQGQQSLDVLHLKRRILKDVEQTKLFFAKREVTKQKMSRETERVRVEKARNQVTMYRKYRIGDLPDIQINYSALIAPLQALAEKDDVVAKMLLTSLIEAILTEMVNLQEESELEEVFAGLSDSLQSILKRSSKHFPPLIGFVMEIAYKRSGKVRLDCDDIAATCIASSQQNLGIVLLEENINARERNQVHHEPKSKRMKKSVDEESDELKPWMKLVELYKSLNNYDAVRGILNKKFANRDLLCEALEYESIGDYNEAAKRYHQAIDQDKHKQNAFLYEVDFWEDSLLQCYNWLTNWDAMEQHITDCLLTDDTPNWNLLWDDAYCQSHYLAYLVRAKWKRLLVRGHDDFLQAFVNDALNDVANPLRRDLLDTKLSGQLALLYAFELNFSQATHYLRCSVNDFLNSWSASSPLVNMQRFAQAQDLQVLAEVNQFLVVAKELDGVRRVKRVEELVERWKNCQLGCLDSLVVWDDVVCNRSLFVDVMSDLSGGKVAARLFQEAKCCCWLAYVESAAKQGNFAVALKTLKVRKRDKKGFLETPDFVLRRHQLCVRVSIARSAQKSQLDKIRLLLCTWEELTSSKNKNDLVKSNSKFAAENHRLRGDLTDFLASALNQNLDVINTLEEGHVDKIENVIGRKLSVDRVVDDLMQLSLKHRQRVVALTSNDVNEWSRAHFEQALFCDNRLREIELAGPNAEFPPEIARNYPMIVVDAFLQAIKLGHRQAIEYFPRLLQIAELYPETQSDFRQKTTAIPCWMFLGWVSQMLALLDKPEGVVVHDILIDIANTYSQALVYPFKLSREGYNLQNYQHKTFIDTLESILNRVQHVDDFIFALGQLTDFDVLFQDHKRKMEEVFRKKGNETELMRLYKCMKNDLFEPDERWGAYRAEFAQQCRNEVQSLDKQMPKIDLKIFQEICQKLQKQIEITKEKLRKRKLFINDYSKWLGNFNMVSTQLEVPGQYVGGQKPVVERHVKIAGFDQTVLNLASIRRPRQITVLGDDEKEYKFLVKQGEDLRLDQRIQQLLARMNTIFDGDSACASRRMRIITYQVIPLTTRLGLVEWVDNTLPLKAFVLSVMSKEELQGYLNRESGIGAQFIKWITAKGGYIASYKTRSNLETCANYRKLVKQLPQNLLKRAFLNMSASLEAFLVLRNHFAVSHATICISHYLLGIGDRHLSNFMIDLNTGSMIGIDFGHAFGSATQFLPFPELMPFRLTPQLLALMEPLREEGIFRQTMIHAASALRKNSAQLINLMDVFVKEPSLDWQEFATKQALLQGADEGETRQACWYPLEKIAFAKRKLSGDNPAHILRDELLLGHKGSPAIKEMIEACLGTAQNKVRSRCKAVGLPVQQQVACLLDQATDENILGHTFQGWEPWI